MRHTLTYYNSNLAQDYLDCTWRILNYARVQGRIDYIKVGRFYYFEVETLRAYRLHTLRKRHKVAAD